MIPNPSFEDTVLRTTPLFLPDVTILPNPVCGSDSALVFVDPDEVDEYVSFSWEPNWNNGGGEVYVEGIVDGINGRVSGCFLDKSPVIGGKVFDKQIDGSGRGDHRNGQEWGHREITE